MTVTKIFTFDAAHRLSDYKGKCKNLHGHTYRVEITVSGELNKLGMVIDFGELKEIYNKIIDRNFDHRTILKEDDPINIMIAETIPEAVCWVPYNPTAENLAQDIFNLVYDELLTKYKSNLVIKLEKIRVYETPTSYAEVKNNV